MCKVARGDPAVGTDNREEGSGARAHRSAELPAADVDHAATELDVDGIALVGRDSLARGAEVQG